MADRQSNTISGASRGVNTRITHKRGKYNLSILSKLKDGELFYDITGTQGIFMGMSNGDGGIDVVKIAGVGGGGITPEEWALIVKKTDIVREIDGEAIYDYNAVLSANAGKALKNLFDGHTTRIDRLEQLFDTEVEHVVVAKVTEIFNKMTGSKSIEIITDPETGYPTMRVRTDETLSDELGALGSRWVSYDEE